MYVLIQYNKKTTWRNEEIKLETGQIVDAFVNTEMKQLHWMSPSVIGVLDTTNPFDPTFKSLKAKEKTLSKEIIIEKTVFLIVDVLVRLFVTTYKDQDWKFCHDYRCHPNYVQIPNVDQIPVLAIL